jgi:hypothetical protein
VAVVEHLERAGVAEADALREDAVAEVVERSEPGAELRGSRGG